MHVELGIFFGQHLGQQFQFVGIDRLLLVRTMQQAAGRQFEAAGRDARQRRLWLCSGVGALGNFDIRNDGFRTRGASCGSMSVPLHARLDADHALDASRSNGLRRIERALDAADGRAGIS